MAVEVGDCRIVRCLGCGYAWCAPVGCDAWRRYACPARCIRTHPERPDRRLGKLLPIDVTCDALVAAWLVGGDAALNAQGE